MVSSSSGTMRKEFNKNIVQKSISNQVSSMKTTYGQLRRGETINK